MTASAQAEAARAAYKAGAFTLRLFRVVVAIGDEVQPCRNVVARSEIEACVRAELREINARPDVDPNHVFAIGVYPVCRETPLDAWRNALASIQTEPTGDWFADLSITSR